MRLQLALAVVAGLAVTACTDQPLPTAATPVAGPPPVTSAPGPPTTVPGVLAVALPVEAGDAANTAFGLAPFGYHGADHAEDGHPGWDIEYRIGGLVRAAATGTVARVFPDPFTAGRTTVQIEHVVGAHHYRTIYTNLTGVRDGVVADATVTAGQVLGAAGVISLTLGTTPVTYAMTHFQLDDLEFHREGREPKAVSPEPFLTPDALRLFERLWANAAFVHELVEPFATNPRGLSFPASRTWTRAGGDGPGGIRFTRRTSRGADYEYALLTESGTETETGTVVLNVAARPFPTIDLVAATGRRLGVYDIVSGEMRLTLGAPNAARPTTLDSTRVYRTSAR